jgi:hypothetical protein
MTLMLRMLPAFYIGALLLVATPVWCAQSDEDKQKKDPKRPSLSIKVSPATGMAPVRVSATAEFKGGDDDFRDYYCPAVEWNWGDGTISEAAADCQPYEPGVSQFRRRYTQSHTYKRAGAYRISFRLKLKDRVLVSQTTMVRLLGGGY